MEELFCGAPCTRKFNELRILRIHQTTCDIFIEAQRLRDRDARAGDSAFERMKKAKRRRIEPEQSTSLAVPTSNLPAEVRRVLKQVSYKY